MDNRKLSVNGTNIQMLITALQLAFAQCGEDTQAVSFIVTDHGLSLLWYSAPGSNPLIAPLTPDQCAEMLFQWVNLPTTTNDSPKYQGDGSSKLGWELFYSEHKLSHYEICTIRPMWIWLGK